jgi:hypothetical protein
LRQASHSAIESIIDSRLKIQLRKRRWLQKTNRYRRDAIKKISSDLKAIPPNPRQRALADYVAAAAPTHLIDGWSLLGQSMASRLQGDGGTAVHLAYYAELRAGMSLLAAEGIGVFSNRHFVIDNHQNAHLLKMTGTHADIWPILDFWSTTQRSQDLLDIAIRPYGQSLSQWITLSGLGSSSRYIAQDWFSSWGIDLKQLGQDREARNHSSYRPTEFNFEPQRPGKEVHAFLTEFWRLCEPQGSETFPLLDKHLLRHALESAFFALSGRKVKDDPVLFTRHIDQALMAMHLGEPLHTELRAFLRRESHKKEPLLLLHATSKSDLHDPSFPLQIISRAALMLRMATGSAQELFRHANVSQPNLRFWWQRYGSERGHWNTAALPGNPIDGWVEVEDCLKGSNAFWEKAVAPYDTLREWRQSNAREMFGLTACELIGIWSLAR